jgi:hypothetical protein
MAHVAFYSAWKATGTHLHKHLRMFHPLMLTCLVDKPAYCARPAAALETAGLWQLEGDAEPLGAANNGSEQRCSLWGWGRSCIPVSRLVRCSSIRYQGFKVILLLSSSTRYCKQSNHQATIKNRSRLSSSMEARGTCMQRPRSTCPGALVQIKSICRMEPALGSSSSGPVWVSTTVTTSCTQER